MEDQHQPSPTWHNLGQPFGTSLRMKQFSTSNDVGLEIQHSIPIGKKNSGVPKPLTPGSFKIALYPKKYPSSMHLGMKLSYIFLDPLALSSSSEKMATLSGFHGQPLQKLAILSLIAGDEMRHGHSVLFAQNGHTYISHLPWKL